MADSKVTRVGGSPDVFEVTLTIEGDDLAPGDVSAVLGCASDESHSKGEPGKRGIPFRRGAWSITQALVGTQQATEVIDALLARLPASADVWDDVRRKYEVSLNLLLIMTDGNRDFVLSAAQVARLGVMNASIWVDIYASADD